MAKKRVNCSDFDKKLTEIAGLLADDPRFRDSPDVVEAVHAEMQKNIPNLTRDMLVDSVVAATTFVSDALESAKRISGNKALRKEIKTDKRLTERIEAIRKSLADDKLLERISRGDKQASEEIEMLRGLRDDLMAAYRASDAVLQENTAKAIKKLQEELVDLQNGTWVAPVKPQESTPSKELRDAQFARDELKKKVNRRIQALQPKNAFERFVMPFFDISRIFKTSFDLSGFRRQGGFFFYAHPIKAFKMMPDMLRSFANKRKAHEALHRNVLEHPQYMDAVQHGVEFTDIDGPLTQQEEAYMSHWVDKIGEGFNVRGRKIGIPGIAASARAYTTYLNMVRMESYSIAANNWAIGGTPTRAEGEVIAYFVNTHTGRGMMPDSLKNASVLANRVFFAPRYAKSRFDMVRFAPILKKGKFGTRRETMRVRKMIALEYGRSLAGLSLFYFMASMALSAGDGEDPQITLNPLSTDFAKIKIGNTRLDPFFGIIQNTTLLFRTGATLGNKWGRESGLGQPFPGDTLLSTGEYAMMSGPDVPYAGDNLASKLAKFGQYKLAPLPSFALEQLTGLTAVNEERTTLSSAYHAFVPLSLRDIYEAMQDQGYSKGAALGVLTIFGDGLNVYSNKEGT